MNLIVPMAGIGKRLRPHTLTVPKPLIPIAGKPIVQRMIEDIDKVCNKKINEVAFVIGDFGKEVEKKLIDIANSLNAKGSIYYQKEALGTAHAVLCAKASLNGEVLVAFADTLFKADFKMDTSKDGNIWVYQVKDPTGFGVVKVNDNNEITEFVEKPDTFVSDLVIMGIYYFKDGAYLRTELQYLIDHEIKDKNEYQITSALENMKNKGTKFIPGKVTEWLDCGNKDATIFANQRYLDYIFNAGSSKLRSSRVPGTFNDNALIKDSDLIAKTAVINNSVIIPPVFIGENSQINNTVIGPYVSLSSNSKIFDSIIKNSIIQEKSIIKNANISNSMIGNFVVFEGKTLELSLGDYNSIKQDVSSQ